MLLGEKVWDRGPLAWKDGWVKVGGMAGIGLGSGFRKTGQTVRDEAFSWMRMWLAVGIERGKLTPAVSQGPPVPP